MPAVSFIVGNTYEGTRSNGKDDWVCYADFFNGDADLVHKVNFHIKGGSNGSRKQTSYCPVKINNGWWRFQVRHQTHGPVRVVVAIIGRGGSIQKRNFRIRCAVGGRESPASKFFERRPNHPLRPVPIPDTDFGIELELSTSSDIASSDVAKLIRERAGVDVESMMDDYSGACSRNDIWVLMTDSSLVCSRDMPGCNRFELKSPILSGGGGLYDVDRVMHALKDIQSSLHVNSSMGFHVHVNIKKLGKYQLASVCQNFIKYERAMDILMPPSRKHGNHFCRSNVQAVGATNGYTHEISQKIASCDSKEELAELMCPTDKYYKLNMRPFLGRQPTIEFRQHSSSYNKLKIKNWIRFCILLVENSARSMPPSPLKKEVGDDELLDMLMMKVVKDRYLRDYYQGRRLKFLTQDGNDDCCEGCGLGEGCVAQRTKLSGSAFSHLPVVF